MCYKLNFIETCLKFFVRAFKRRHTHTQVWAKGGTRGSQGGYRVFVCLLRISFACFGPLLQCKQSRQAGRPAPPSVARPRQLNLIPNCQFSVRKRQQQQQKHRQQHCVLSASEKETGVEGGFACVHYATTKRKTKQSFQFDD